MSKQKGKGNGFHGSLMITSPAQDNDTHPVTSGGTIECSGTWSAGTAGDLLRVHARCYRGNIQTTDPPVHQKPHHSTSPIPASSGPTTSSTWTLSSVPGASGGTTGTDFTLIVWGDFDGEREYVLVRRHFRQQ